MTCSQANKSIWQKEAYLGSSGLLFSTSLRFTGASSDKVFPYVVEDNSMVIRKCFVYNVESLQHKELKKDVNLCHPGLNKQK